LEPDDGKNGENRTARFSSAGREHFPEQLRTSRTNMVQSINC